MECGGIEGWLVEERKSERGGFGQYLMSKNLERCDSSKWILFSFDLNEYFMLTLFFLV